MAAKQGEVKREYHEYEYDERTPRSEGGQSRDRDRKPDRDRDERERERKREFDYDNEPRSDYEDASPEEIEADIRRTRAEMDQTLEELQQRLNPRNLWGEVVGMFRSKKSKSGPTESHDGGKGEMAKKVGMGVLHFVRDHPVPSVLVTTAVTTLIYETASRKRSQSRGRSNIRSINIYRGEPTMYGGSHVHAQSGQPYRETAEHIGQQQFQFGSGGGGDEPGAMQRAGQKAGQKVGEMREQASEKMSQAGEKMSQAGESVRGGMHQASESVRSGMHHASESVRSGIHRTSEAVRSGTEKVREGASHVGEQMRHGMESTREFIEERPITVGIGALALGLIAGLLIPRSEKEDRLMGERSEQLVERGKEKGRDLYERGKHVAEEAMEAAAEAASEESEKQGLKPE